MVDVYPGFDTKTLGLLTKELASAVRGGEVAPLVGAGLSIPAGLPSWSTLVERMIHGWEVSEHLPDEHDATLKASWVAEQEAIAFLSDKEDLSSATAQVAGEVAATIDQVFEGDDLATVSYLRSLINQKQNGAPPSRVIAVSEAPGKFPGTIGDLIYYAFYMRKATQDANDTSLEPRVPLPDAVHRHLIALFAKRPGRIWTGNYDDLIEAAAEQVSVGCRTIDPDRFDPSTDLDVAHLHGFLAPPDEGRSEDRSRSRPHPGPDKASIVLAEDDYHDLTIDTVGWTNREFYRLFSEYRVLVLGMSLTDRNLRRVLSTMPKRLKFGSNGYPRHFAVMRSISLDECVKHMLRRELKLALKEDSKGPESQPLPEKVDALCERIEGAIDKVKEMVSRPYAPETLELRRKAASKARSEYWRGQGIQIIEIPEYESILPFLVRLRYESFGDERGDLWRKSAELVRQKTEGLWDEDRQVRVCGFLRGMVHDFREKFSIDDSSEITDIGIFLLKNDARTLKLTFRSRKRCGPESVEFSADPDDPTGLAGLVFVTGEGMRVGREDPRFDYGLDEEAKRRRSNSYEGVIAVPIVRWQKGGTPIGVIYVTTRTKETVLELPDKELNPWLNYTGLLAIK